MEQRYVPAAIVRATQPLLIETRHALACGDRLEYLGRTIEPEIVTVTGLRAEDGAPLARVNPGRLVELDTEPKLGRVERQTLLRKHLELP